MQTSDAGSTLILSGRLGVQQARPLWEAAQAAMAEHRPVVVQAGDVEDLDTSVAQILCRVASRGGRLRISGSSDGFLLALARRGLDQFFVHAASGGPVAEAEMTSTAAEAPGEGVARPISSLKKTRSSKGRKPRD